MNFCFVPFAPLSGSWSGGFNWSVMPRFRAWSRFGSSDRRWSHSWLGVTPWAVSWSWRGSLGSLGSIRVSNE